MRCIGITIAVSVSPTNPGMNTETIRNIVVNLLSDTLENSRLVDVNEIIVKDVEELEDYNAVDKK